MASQYFLLKHIYARETGGHAVFLDLKRNRYTQVEPGELTELRRNVCGWPRPLPGDAANGGPQLHQDSDTILRLLVKEGILTVNSDAGKSAVPITIDQVTQTIDDVRSGYPSVTWPDFVNFVRAWVITTATLRVLPLSWVVNRVLTRKAKYRPVAQVFDPHQAHRLMTAYWILRPNFFEAQDACLRDSLTFVEFFSYYSMYPTLVFGVKTNPFAAHAWVQEGPMVLNDYIPNVAGFAPILAV